MFTFYVDKKVFVEARVGVFYEKSSIMSLNWKVEVITQGKIVYYFDYELFGEGVSKGPSSPLRGRYYEALHVATLKSQLYPFETEISNDTRAPLLSLIYNIIWFMSIGWLYGILV